jgi:glycine/D-amino acid oxidase-like deaminating enzyme/nitrite reductase/ring-hydroxylating ferredoxin subunit
MSTNSLWIEECRLALEYPRLETNKEAEVCVIGGGITGVMSAYYLAKAGKKVVLLESGRIGHGETGYTTAFITYVTDAKLKDLVKTFKEKKAKLVYESGRDIIDEMERIIEEEQIDCEFVRCPVSIYPTSEKDVAELKEEGELMKRLGFPFEYEEASEHFPWGRAIVQGQAKFHPRHFLLAVAEKAKAYGAQIYEGSAVVDFIGREGNIVKTKDGQVTAHEIVEATHNVIDHPIEVPARLETSLSYVIEARVPKGIFTEGIYWDTEDPYHYFRIDPKADYDRLILGGEDRKTGTEDHGKEFEHLTEYLGWLLHDRDFSIIRKWSGQILESPDGIPFIGRSLTNSHHIIATGYAGNGMTFGTIAARVITDLIMGQENPLSDLYSPTRFKRPLTMFRLGIQMTKEWISGHLAPRHDDVTTIAPGCGAVVIRDGKKVAISKDDDGSVLMVSAVCTHLGCVVNWNIQDKTWDCPCHGSRFARDGKVVNGPANKPLPPV